MASKQNELKMNIVLAGKVDNSITKIGAAIENIGSQTKVLSDKLISFGTDALEVYRKYEDGILETRSVWQDIYDSEAALDRAMDSLEEKAQEWASTTVFHTNDVSEAMADAAHAGWNYEMMMEGMPAAMLLAQAGNMDLAESVDYISKTLNSTGTAFEDAEGFLDSWAKAANLVSTDIPEMGDALRNLGSASQLAANTDEVMTFLSALASVGTVGASAGTHLRAVFLRMVAPTKAAAEAMDMLNLSEEEIDEAFEDITEESDAAYQQLEQLGFSAYDQQGNLKGFIELFTDLNTALNELETDQERNKVLSTLFPQRTFADAQTFLNMVQSGELFRFYDEISGVEEGYMEKIAETRMSGLTGATEILGSKWEELQRKTGEMLAPDAESVYGMIGNVLDGINSIDDGKFSTIISALEGFAVTGPMLMIAGKAIKYIGSLFSPVGVMGVGAAALGAWVVAAEKMQDLNMSDSFGTMALDMEKISGYISGIGSDYEEQFSTFNQLRTELDQCLEDYTTKSSEMVSTMMNAMLTESTLTEPEKAQLFQLGDDIYGAVYDGIGNAVVSRQNFWETFFGGEGVAEGNETYLGFFAIEESTLQKGLDTATYISQRFRDALTSAFEDGKITKEEYQELVKFYDEYNKALADAALESEKRNNYIEMQSMIYRAQGASWESVQEAADMMRDRIDALVTEAEDNYIASRSGLIYDYENGNTAGYSETEFYDEMLPEADRKWLEQKAALESEGDVFLKSLYTSAISSSDLADPYKELMGYAEQVMNGTMSAYDAASIFAGKYGANGNAGGVDITGTGVRTRLSTYLEDVIDSFGGLDYVMNQDDDWFKMLYAMQQINDEFNNGTARISGSGMMGTVNNRGLTEFNAWMNTGNAQPVRADDFYTNGLGNAKWIIEPIVDFATNKNVLSFAKDTHAREMRTATQTIEDGITNAYPWIVNRISDLSDWLDSNLLSGIAKNGQSDENPILSVQAEATGLEESTKVQLVTAQEFLDKNPGQWNIRPNIQTNDMPQSVATDQYSIGMYAEGGRADEPSIFGEAGAEWAIPEEHTMNTATLLQQAATASGFTWSDIAAATGSTGGTLVYSPTIYAQNAAGVEQKLSEDKDRLEKWWKSRSMKEDIAVYA